MEFVFIVARAKIFFRTDMIIHYARLNESIAPVYTHSHAIASFDVLVHLGVIIFSSGMRYTIYITTDTNLVIKYTHRHCTLLYTAPNTAYTL